MSEPIKLSSRETNQFWEIPVLYEDPHFLAVEKPAQLFTSADRSDPAAPNLIKLLHAGIAEKKPWAASRALAYLGVAHRLDFDASGVVVLAKSKADLVYLANLFGSEKVQARQIALVQGTPKEDSFEIDAKITPHPKVPGLVLVNRRRGKKSRTAVRTLEKFRGWTLVECHPQTHRPYQVRAHLRSVGLPIVGDNVYGGKPLLLSRLKPGYQSKRGGPERPLIGRVALHNEEMRFAHPARAEEVAVKSPRPKELEVGLKYLRQYAAG